MAHDPFFARFFPGEDFDAQSVYHRTLRRYLPDPGRVLDLGCGDHRELDGYRLPDREIWGTDPRPHPRLVTPEWFRPLPADGRLPFPSDSFDLVTCSWVLEHVDRPLAFLAEVARVLRPGGHLVALTPNGDHYVTWVSRLVGLLPHRVTQALVRRLYGRQEHDTFPTHYRLNTPPRLRHGARAAGLKLVELAGFANPYYFSFWEPLRRGGVLLDWTLERWYPGLGRLYWVVTLRKPGAAVGTAEWPAPHGAPSADQRRPRDRSLAAPRMI